MVQADARRYLSILQPVIRLLASKSKMPVFILGCQRSGTTICQNVFLKSRRFTVYREGNKDAMKEGWRLRSFPEIAQLIDRSKTETIIFKPINDSQSALEMLEYFNNSRIIWIYRNFHDTANSAVATWGSVQRDVVVWIGEALAQYGSVEKAMPAMMAKPDYAVYAERLSPKATGLLVDWTSAAMSEHTGAAAMWYLRNRLFFDQDLDTNGRALLVNYEKLARRPREQIRRMCDFMRTQCPVGAFRQVHAGAIGKYKAPDISASVRRCCEDLLDRLNRVEHARPT